MSNHPQYCLTNIPFSLTGRICAIVEKESVKEIKLLRIEKKKHCWNKNTLGR